MKVNIAKNSGEWMTVNQMKAARQIVAECKNDGYIVTEWAKQAANVFGPGNWSIYDAVAEIGGNYRVKDVFFDGSGTLDVYIHFKAYDRNLGFYDAGMYLSDIWSMDGSNYDEIRSRMFYLEFQQK